MLHFSVKKTKQNKTKKKYKKKKQTVLHLNLPIETYRVLKSKVYVISPIRDLTNSNNMHFFLTIN